MIRRLFRNYLSIISWQFRRQKIIVIGLMLRFLFGVSFPLNEFQNEEIMSTTLDYNLEFHRLMKGGGGERKYSGQLQNGIYLLAAA
jgi:hypothetical protein